MTDVKKADAVIASSGTVSTAVDLTSTTGVITHVPVGFYMPAAWTAADITFQASNEGTTFVAMQDGAGNAITKTVAVDLYIPLDPADFAGVQHLKLVSSNAQGAERTLIVVFREI